MKNCVFLLLLIPHFFFSQEIVLENLALKNAEIEIPGTLSYPKTEEKIPLVIYIHGSGNIDRNGIQPGTYVQANYIKTLADSINAKGIAFYRYDKRTANPANFSKLKNISLTDFVEDAKVAINKFEDDIRFSGIHLIGHSQGSLVAMLAVSKAVNSYTSVAGPSTTIDKTILMQLEKQSKDLSKAAADHFAELKRTDTILEVNISLISVFAPQNQKFIAQWMALNPSEEIQKLKIPVMILQGDADLQVAVSDAENLAKAKPDALLKIIPKMNHILKEINSMEENTKSYSDETFPLSFELVTSLTKFILSN